MMHRCRLSDRDLAAASPRSFRGLRELSCRRWKSSLVVGSDFSNHPGCLPRLIWIQAISEEF